MAATLFVLAPATLAFAEPDDASMPNEPVNPMRIFVLDAPYLSWSDIRDDTMPITSSFMEEAGLTNVVTRSVWRPGNAAITVNEAAGTIDAGQWVRDPLAPTILCHETEPSGLGAEQVAFVAAGKLPARLGARLTAADWTTIALGCSDQDSFAARPALMLLANDYGIVPVSCTQPNYLLIDDKQAPYGRKTNLNALSSLLTQALAKTPGNAVIGLDSGDLGRAGSYRVLYPGETADAYWTQALASFDATVALALANMDENDVLFIYSSLNKVTQANHQDEAYAPLIVYGAGYKGILGSPSTGRSDLALLPDVSSTILHLAGLDSRFENAGVLYNSGDPASEQPWGETSTYLQYESSLADAINKGQEMMNFVMGTLLALAFVLAGVMLSPRITLRERTLEMLIPPTRIVWLMTAAFPLSTYLMLPLVPYGATAEVAVALCLVLMVALTVVAILVGGFTRWLYSLIFLMALTIGVLLVDQLLFEGSLARVGFLSYQPIRTGRYMGIGNEGAVVLFGSWFMFAGLLLNRFPKTRASKVFRIAGFPLASLAIMCVIVAPWWGANFGVLVWGTIGAIACWWMFQGRRLSWRVILTTMAVCVLLAVCLVVLDGLFSSASHLGATLSLLIERGGAYVLVIVNNMLRLSISTLFYNPVLSAGLVVMWIYLAWVRIKKPGAYPIFWERNPYFKAAFTAVMVTAVVMLLIEDSGILLPALILLYATASLTWLICDLHRWELRASESERGVLAEQVETPVGSFKTSWSKRRLG